MTDTAAMFDSLPPGPTANGYAVGPAPNEPTWRHVAPIPEDAPEPPRLKGSQRWWYRDAEGRSLFAVDRYELRRDGERKQFIPLTLWQNDSGELVWMQKYPPAPRPLYGLDRLAQRPNATALVNEGEKSADAAGELFPDHVAVTSPGGAQAAGKSDWSALAGRHVVIWPDNDEPGRRYAEDVARLAGEARAASVRVVEVPGAWPAGWDLADALPDGVSLNALQVMLDDAVEQRLPRSASRPEEGLDLKREGLTQRDALLQICDEATVWRSTEGDAFASVPVDGHVEHYAVGSRNFRIWMLYRLAHRFTQDGRPASANENAIRDARSAIEARALIEGAIHPVKLRIVDHEASIYIDLGTPDWSVVKVDADGWSFASRAPVPIIRSKRTAAFALPAGHGDFGPLRELLAHLNHDDFVLLIAWCVGTLLPLGPYPILVLGGEQGTGKSTLARLVQRITDPVHGDLLQPPGNDRDLIAAAKASRVLSFDNLSSLTPDLADSICRLSTGSQIGGRAMYTDHDLASFSACRALIINGIPDLATRGDLADRALVLRLAPLAGRITESDWRARVDAVLPPTFAALLDALSFGLRRLAITPTPDIRMADFARIVVAAEPVLPWGTGEFMAAYRRSRADAGSVLADGDTVASAIRTFMGPSRAAWSGLMSGLYQEVSNSAASEGRKPADWPGDARWFGDRLRRSAPTLRALGIDFRERRTGDGNRVTLERIDALATSATPTAPNAGASDVTRPVASDANVAMDPMRGAASDGKPQTKQRLPDGSERKVYVVLPSIFSSGERGP